MSTITDNELSNLYADYARPMYVYDEKVILRQAKTLIETFPDFEFLYSIKTNPFFPVVRSIAGAGAGVGVDAASEREVGIAHEMEVPKNRVLFSTPGKTRENIERSIDTSIGFF